MALFLLGAFVVVQKMLVSSFERSIQPIGNVAISTVSIHISLSFPDEPHGAFDSCQTALFLFGA
jgi:hypothetical protein